MTRNLIASGLCAIILVACASEPPPRLEISRFDGGAISAAVREQAQTECGAKSFVAKSYVTAVPADRYGILRSAEQANVHAAAFEACMAEKGMRIEWVQDSPPTQTAAMR